MRLLALLALACFPGTVRAELPPVEAGQIVLFSEDFADNRNDWSAIIATDLSTRGAMNQARVVDSEWSPSEPGGESIKSTVESMHVFEKPIDLEDGPVTIYLRARVDVPRGGDGNRFGVSIQEAKRKSIASLVLRPGMNSLLDHRNDVGKLISTRVGSVRFEEGSYRLLKLSVSATWSVDGYLGRAEAFVYEPELRKYVSLGTVDESVFFKTGKLEQLALFSRNGGTGFCYIDSVVVAQAKR